LFNIILAQSTFFQIKKNLNEKKVLINTSNRHLNGLAILTIPLPLFATVNRYPKTIHSNTFYKIPSRVRNVHIINHRLPSSSLVPFLRGIRPGGEHPKSIVKKVNQRANEYR